MSWTSALPAAEPRSTAAPGGDGHWPAARSPIPTGWSARRAFCPTAAACCWPCANGWSRLDCRSRVPRSTSGFCIRSCSAWATTGSAAATRSACSGPSMAFQETSVYQQSPMRILFEGAGAVRQRLDLPDVAFRFPLFYELRDRGADRLRCAAGHFQRRQDPRHHLVVRSARRLHDRRSGADL